MQPVSDDWKENQEQTIVDESLVKITLKITDPDAVADASVAGASMPIYFAPGTSLLEEEDKNIIPYTTLEHNLWLLDGNLQHIPSNNYGDTGYISSDMNEPSGEFENPISILISFSEMQSKKLPGITIIWSEEFNEYATDFHVMAYNGATLIADKSITENDRVKTFVNLEFENYTSIRIDVMKWCLPFRRVRIEQIFIGLKYDYTKNELISMEQVSEADPLNARLPKNELTFELDNSLGEFKPGIDEGISKYLSDPHEIEVKHGYKLNDGIEWIKGGVYFLNDWQASPNNITARFSGGSLLNLLMYKTFYNAGFHPQYAYNLYDLAMNVLQAADLPLLPDGTPRWIIDDSLQYIYTIAALPLLSMAECLQLIASAAGCILFVDRSGILHIEPLGTGLEDYEINPFNSYEHPEIRLTKPLKQVDVSTYRYFVDLNEEPVELYNGTVYVSGTKWIRIVYSQLAAYVNINISGGILNQSEYYSNSCNLNITGDGDVHIVLTGNSVKKSENIVSIPGDDPNGEIQKVENLLITSVDQALEVGNLVKSYLTGRKIVSTKWRADPRLDVLDIINVTGDFGSATVRTNTVKYVYNGAFRGECEGRVV